MPLYDASKVRDALTLSSFAQPLAPASDPTGRLAGTFFMQRGSMQLTVYVRRKKDYPHSIYLYMGRGDNNQQGSGLGTAFMLDVFDIADCASVEHVTTRSTEIGRYTNAANHIQCHRQHWPALQEELLDALDSYHAAAKKLSPAEADRQAKLAETAIELANGALGPLVYRLRAEPNLLPVTGKLQTLAKQLFLGTAETKSYEGYWDEAGRAQARRALAQRCGKLRR